MSKGALRFRLLWVRQSFPFGCRDISLIARVFRFGDVSWDAGLGKFGARILGTSVKVPIILGFRMIQSVELTEIEKPMFES